MENPWDDPWLPNFSGRLEGRAWEGLSVEDVPAMEPMDWSNKLLSLLLSPLFSKLNIYQKNAYVLHTTSYSKFFKP